MERIKQFMRGSWNPPHFGELALDAGYRSALPPTHTTHSHNHTAHVGRTACRVVTPVLQRSSTQDPMESLLSIAVQSDQNAPRFHTARQTPTVQICYYESLMQLRSAMNLLDEVADSHRLSLFLVLDDHCSAHLPTLIARQSPALQLVLAVPSGRLPGNVTVGDLDATSGSLGWREIVFERSIKQGLARTICMLEDQDRLVIFWPAWHDRQDVERIATN